MFDGSNNKFDTSNVLKDIERGSGSALDEFRHQLNGMNDKERRSALDAIGGAVDEANKKNMASYWQNKPDTFQKMAIDTSETEKGLFFSSKLTSAEIVIAEKTRDGKVLPHPKKVELYASEEGREVSRARELAMPYLSYAMTVELAGDANDVKNIIEASDENRDYSKFLGHAGWQHKDQYERNKILDVIDKHVLDQITKEHPQDPPHTRLLALKELRNMLNGHMNEAREMERRAHKESPKDAKLLADIQDAVVKTLTGRSQRVPPAEDTSGHKAAT